MGKTLISDGLKPQTQRIFGFCLMKVKKKQKTKKLGMESKDLALQHTSYRSLGK